MTFVSSAGQKYSLLPQSLACPDQNKCWSSRPLHYTGLVTQGEEEKGWSHTSNANQYTPFSLFIKRVFTHLEATYQSGAFTLEPACHYLNLSHEDIG